MKHCKKSKKECISCEMVPEDKAKKIIKEMPGWMQEYAIEVINRAMDIKDTAPKMLG